MSGEARGKAVDAVEAVVVDVGVGIVESAEQLFGESRRAPTLDPRVKPACRSKR
jgi:hypothetical protein